MYLFVGGVVFMVMRNFSLLCLVYVVTDCLEEVCYTSNRI